MYKPPVLKGELLAAGASESLLNMYTIPRSPAEMHAAAHGRC